MIKHYLFTTANFSSWVSRIVIVSVLTLFQMSTEGAQTIAPDLMTNTRRNKTYDHILIDRNMTTEFTGKYGAIDLQQYFGISEEEALAISDHLPVWAEFTAHETRPAPAPQPNNVATEPQVIR